MFVLTPEKVLLLNLIILIFVIAIFLLIGAINLKIDNRIIHEGVTARRDRINFIDNPHMLDKNQKNKMLWEQGWLDEHKKIITERDMKRWQ